MGDVPNAASAEAERSGIAIAVIGGLLVLSGLVAIGMSATQDRSREWSRGKPSVQLTFAAQPRG